MLSGDFRAVARSAVARAEPWGICTANLGGASNNRRDFASEGVAEGNSFAEGNLLDLWGRLAPPVNRTMRVCSSAACTIGDFTAGIFIMRGLRIPSSVTS